MEAIIIPICAAGVASSSRASSSTSSSSTMHNATAGSAALVYTCNLCNLDFTSRNKLFLHVRQAHFATDGELDEEQRGNCSSRGEDSIRSSAAATTTTAIIRHAFDDDDLALLVKPQGIPTISPSGQYFFSSMIPATKGRGGGFTLRPCHRIDCETGGIVLCCKNYYSLTFYSLCFKFKLIKKVYRAIVKGDVTKSLTFVRHISSGGTGGTIDSCSTGFGGGDGDGNGGLNDSNINNDTSNISSSSISSNSNSNCCSSSSGSGSNSNNNIGGTILGRGSINLDVYGKLSETDYEVVSVIPSAKYGSITTLDLYPRTGRRHQLRKHLKGIGHPIIGDKRFASTIDLPDFNRFPTMFLWAYMMEFPVIEPSNSDVLINCLKDMERGRLKRRFKEVAESTSTSASTVASDCRSDGDIEDADDDDDEDELVIDVSKELDRSNSNNSSSSSSCNSADSANSVNNKIITSKGIINGITYSNMTVKIDEPSFFEDFRRSQTI